MSKLHRSIRLTVRQPIYFQSLGVKKSAGRELPSARESWAVFPYIAHLEEKMKRILAIALTMCMTVGVMIVSLPKEEVKEETPLVVDTETYFTEIDYSLLYNLREDERKKEVVDLTYPEAVALMKIGKVEGGTSVQGQAAVMAVILNRIKSDSPDFQGIETVGQAIYQKGQFSTVDSGAFDNAEVDLNSHLALAMVESGIDLVDGALWFESSTNSSESWHKRNLMFVKEIEGNLFYK